MASLTEYTIVVLGANGGIGKQIVLVALQAGHSVTAILRTPGNLQLVHPKLKLIQGDVMRPETFERQIKQTDVIVSAIGKNSFKKTVLYSTGNHHLIQMMKRVGADRAFFISASGLEVNPSHSLLIRLATRYILQSLLRNMYADLVRMEKLVKESKINWTIVRPPRLVDGASTGQYRMAVNGYVPGGLTISRADVAHFIINNLVNKAICQKTVEIAY